MLADKPRTAGEYREWWYANTDVPYGHCWCGCGQKTNISPQGVTKYGYVRGEPRPHITNHHSFSLDFAARKEIANRYQAGEAASGLADGFGVKVGTIHAILRAFQVPNHRANLMEDQEQRVCEAYMSGATTRKVATDFGIGASTVKRVLRRNGVKARSRSEARRIYSCDDRFFSEIDTETKAYVLGFLAADGGIRNNTISIALQRSDHDHLLRLKAVLRATNPIGLYTSRCSTGEYLQATLNITSAKLCQDLAIHGIIPRKTKVFTWPETVPSDMLRHFLRGYSDGDGCFHVGQSSYVRKRDGKRAETLVWNIVGTDPFCTGAQEYLIRTIGVSKTKLYSHRRAPGVVTLSYGGNAQVLRVWHLLYDDATVYLPRKREIATPYID